MKVDLENANPMGRVDVLAYRLVKHYAKALEAQHGISGVWDNVQPHVQTLVSRTITGLALPVEANILLGILQANMMPKVEQVK
jgi:hypothetical protein